MKRKKYPKYRKNSQDEFQLELKKAYYEMLGNGFIQTTMKLDETLLTISSGAIGLIVTLITTLPLKSCWILFGYFSAAILFLVTIGVIISIFHYNKLFVEGELNETSKGIQKNNLDNHRSKQDDLERKLKKRDKFAKCCFISGLIVLFIIIVKIGVDKMSNPENPNKQNSSGLERIDEKLLKVTEIGQQKSFSGMRSGKPSISTGASVNESLSGIRSGKPLEEKPQNSTTNTNTNQNTTNPKKP
jgi:hypothetical protein